jgi:hypothetical protein
MVPLPIEKPAIGSRRWNLTVSTTQQPGPDKGEGPTVYPRSEQPVDVTVSNFDALLFIAWLGDLQAAVHFAPHQLPVSPGGMPGFEALDSDELTRALDTLGIGIFLHHGRAWDRFGGEDYKLPPAATIWQAPVT